MCNCIESVNESLEARGVKVAQSWNLETGIGVPGVRLVRTDGSDRPPPRGTASVLTATHCPFCGEKYYPEATHD